MHPLARRTPVLAALLLVLVGALPAHGGQYRGWSSAPVPSGNGASPATGGMAGPSTGARPGIQDGTSWQVWWEFSKDPLLQHVGNEGRPVVTGSDDFFLGGTRRPVVETPTAALRDDELDRVAKALADALASTDNRDIATAAMVALAKLGRGPRGVDLVQLLCEQLNDGNQEVRETAALALGISGDQKGLEPLAELVGDSRAGRRLCGNKGDVDDRTRTFAAWGLGLLAGRSPERAVKQRVHDLLLHELQDRSNRSRDLRVGLIEGLGLLGEQESGANKLLLWRTAAELWSYFEEDLGRGDHLVQAHVPIAIARLLGRGTSSEHEAAKQRLLGVLTGSRRVHQTILQSAAMALGSLCVPPEVHEGDTRICDALLDYYEDGTDQLARHFSVLALGRIGGARNREALLRLFPTSNGNIERPWIALALGLIAREQRARTGAIDRFVAELLHDELVDRNNDDAKAALVLAVGLAGFVEAESHMMPLLDEGLQRWQLIGYGALGLSLIESRVAGDRLLQLLDERRREPFIVQQASLALARLRDARLLPKLHELLDKSDSAAELAAIANALSLVGDHSSIDTLIAALGDKDRPKIARAFAAAGLGGIADKDELPWNTRIAVGMNYMAHVDTLTNGMTGILDIL